jgi:NAD(P)H dehydrogenase (quinone)
MILVTGTSGALGRLILDKLTAVPDLPVAAGTRTPTGDSTRRIDFDEPGSLADGFADVDVLVFISAGYAEDDVVLRRHAAVIEAAAKAGIRHVIYTSLASSGDRLSIALAHRWTEARLAVAPFDVTILRNGLYAELVTGLVLASAESAASTGVYSAPLGLGRMPVVARQDLADAAAHVAIEAHANQGQHKGRTYELEGVTAVGGQNIAAVLTHVLGRPVRYEPALLGDTRAALAATGLLPYQVAHMVSMFSNINAGMLKPRDSDLPGLLSDPPRPVLNLITNAASLAWTSRNS